MPEQMREKTHASQPSPRVHELASRHHAYTHPLLHLQKSLGNQALLRLRGHLGTLQTKLSLGQPDDLYEQEADSVASRIIQQMSKMDQGIPGTDGDTSQPVHMVQRQEEEEELAMPRRSEAIQRQTLEDEEEEEMMQTRRSETIQRQVEEEEEIQARRFDTMQRQEEEELVMPHESDEDRSGSLVAGPVPDALEHQVESAKQGGDILDGTIRSRMESGFGYNFQNVHIHNDSVADNLSRQLSAEAFTLNNDIFFRNGRYDPSSTQGQNLLAHELTHVVQQGAAPNQTTSVPAESTGGV